MSITQAEQKQQLKNLKSDLLNQQYQDQESIGQEDKRYSKIFSQRK